MDLVETPRLYAYTGGKAFDPALPTIVFLHGGEHDHSVWILQSRYMAHHGYSVLALDLPGHMRSAGPALTTIESMSEIIAGALKASGAERLLLVGHSMGSLVALELAAVLAREGVRRRPGSHRISDARVRRAARCNQGLAAAGDGNDQRVVAQRFDRGVRSQTFEPGPWFLKRLEQSAANAARRAAQWS